MGRILAWAPCYDWADAGKLSLLGASGHSFVFTHMFTFFYALGFFLKTQVSIDFHFLWSELPWTVLPGLLTRNSLLSENNFISPSFLKGSHPEFFIFHHFKDVLALFSGPRISWWEVSGRVIFPCLQGVGFCCFPYFLFVFGSDQCDHDVLQFPSSLYCMGLLSFLNL